MKKAIVSIVAAVFAVVAAAPQAEARHYPRQSSHIYVSGYHSCGTPVYTERYVIGYHRCGTVRWGYRTVAAPRHHHAPRYYQAPRRYSPPPVHHHYQHHGGGRVIVQGTICR